MKSEAITEAISKQYQSRVFKIITGGIIRIPTLNLYNEIGLKTLKKRRERSVILFFSKVINNMVPDYLLELKPEKKKEGCYMLRTRHEYTPPSWKITKYKIFFYLSQFTYGTN